MKKGSNHSYKRGNCALRMPFVSDLGTKHSKLALKVLSWRSALFLRINMCTPQDKKARSKNWSAKDSCVLVDVYEKYHDIITGRFKGRLVTAEKKDAAWKSLTAEFNQLAVDYSRKEEEIQKKIENLRDAVRRFVTASKQFQTGGGPKPNEPEKYIEKMYSIIYGETGDALVGIGSGVESGAGIAESIVESPSAVLSIESAGSKSCADEHITDEPLVIAPEPSSKKRRVIEDRKSSPSASDVTALQYRLLQAQLALVEENRELVATQKVLAAEQLELCRERRSQMGFTQEGSLVEFPSMNRVPFAYGQRPQDFSFSNF